MFVSHGGRCLLFQKDVNGVLLTETPIIMQAEHEEADTLIAFHASQISSRRVMIRSSETDVLVILLSMKKTKESTIIMDYGCGNNRRFINVSSIAMRLEENQPGTTGALLELHALTGCDYTSAFFRKGKGKPFERLQKDDLYIKDLQSLTLEPDINAITSFVCRLYGFNCNNINVARFKVFLCMSEGTKSKPLARIKRINCASLPPSAKSLANHIKRANFVAEMRKNANEPQRTNGESPLDYGWKSTSQGYLPEWFVGNALPSALRNDEAISSQSERGEESDGAWSESSSDESDDDNMVFTNEYQIHY